MLLAFAQFFPRDFRTLSASAPPAWGSLRPAGVRLSPWSSVCPPCAVFSPHYSCVCVDVVKPLASLCQIHIQDRETKRPLTPSHSFGISLVTDPQGGPEGHPGYATYRKAPRGCGAEFANSLEEKALLFLNRQQECFFF